MKTWAAVITGKGTAALSVIQLCGDGASGVLGEIFQPAGAGIQSFEVGQVLVGKISDGRTTIDHVTVGCEGPGTFAIGCHGNPLIVERIMQLLESKGVALTSDEEMLKRTAGLSGEHAIATEARIALAKVRTLSGAKLITRQVADGLTETAKQWLDMPLEDIREQAREILSNTGVVERILNGCTVVLAGPPNSGKSTLLNQLCGRDKAIVADIPGTTRDWVSGTCLAEPLELTIIDTAGLDVELAASEEIDNDAQQRAIELLRTADVVLLVLDITRDQSQISNPLMQIIRQKPVIAVLNKSEMLRFAQHDMSALPPVQTTVPISAKTGNGIEQLLDAVREVMHVTGFDPASTAAFTSRQKTILEHIVSAESVPEARVQIEELINGPLCV